MSEVPRRAELIARRALTAGAALSVASTGIGIALVGSGAGLAPIPTWYVAPVVVALGALVLVGLGTPWMPLRWLRLSAAGCVALYVGTLVGFGAVAAVAAPDAASLTLPWVLTSYGGPALAAVVAGGEAAGLALAVFAFVTVTLYRLVLGGAPTTLTPFISDTQTGLSALALCIVGGALIRAAVRTDLVAAAVGRASVEEAEVRGGLVARSRSAAFVHDEVLVALRAAADGDERSTEAVQRQAQRALHLAEHAAVPDSGAPGRSWIDALESEAREYDPDVRIEVAPDARAATPDQQTTGALVGAARQAIENSVRHAPGASRRLRIHGDAHGVFVEISDDGSGFDPTAVAPGRLGIKSSIVDAMRLVGGDADVRSSVGSGTTVTLIWRRAAAELSAAVSRSPRVAVRAHAIKDRRFDREIWVLIALFYVTQGAIACAVAVRTPSGGDALAIYVALGVAGVLAMFWRQSSARLGSAVLTGLIIAATLAGIAVTPSPATYGQAWFLPAAGLVLSGVALRLRPAPTLVGLIVLVFGTVVHVVLRGIDLELIIAAVRMGLLVVLGALLSIVIQRVQRLSVRANEDAIVAMQERAWDDATGRELERRAEDLDLYARPLLQILASGVPLTDADRDRARAVEGRLRDGYRAASLVREPLTEEVMRARLRGVDVILLDDTENAPTEDAVIQAVTDWMSTLVARSRHRFVGRLLPADRDHVAHAVIDDVTFGFTDTAQVVRLHGSVRGFQGE